MRLLPAALIFALVGCGRWGFDQPAPDDGGAGTLDANDGGPSGLTSVAYLKASNTDAGDAFGSSVALSADGSTLAVAASFEASTARGVNGNQASNAGDGTGAAYVFAWSGMEWMQQAYLKAANADPSDEFGDSIVLSADGNTLAVGAHQEDSNSANSPSNNGAQDSGAAYVFTRAGSVWTQQGYLKASNNDAGDFFGGALAISADGNTIVVGARNEDCSETGVGVTGSDDAAPDSGAAYVYTRTGMTWIQQAYLKASNTATGDGFGTSVAISASGDVIAVGALSAGTGGAAYVYARSGGVWSFEKLVEPDAVAANDQFGRSVALSGGAELLAVGAHLEDGAASDSGAVILFGRAGGAWTQQVSLKASNPGADDQFGSTLAMSSDGTCLVASAPNEDSEGRGIGSSGIDDNAMDSGAAYVFRADGGWHEDAILKASNSEPDDRARTVAMSTSCSVIALGVQGEDGVGAGTSADSSDNSASSAGSVNVFR